MSASPFTDHTTVATISWVERLNNSVNGNPRFRLHLDDATSVLTQSDASVNYDVGNLSYHKMIGVPVKLTLTRAGRVFGISKL